MESLQSMACYILEVLATLRCWHRNTAQCSRHSASVGEIMGYMRGVWQQWRRGGHGTRKGSAWVVEQSYPRFHGQSLWTFAMPRVVLTATRHHNSTILRSACYRDGRGALKKFALIRKRIRADEQKEAELQRR